MRRSPDRGRLVVALVLVAVQAAGAQPPEPKPPDAKASGGFLGLGGQRSKDPITITSDNLEYEYKDGIIVYRGEVVAVQGDVKVRSNELRITLAKTDGGKSGDASAAGPLGDASSSKLEAVVASGNVRIDQGTRWAVGGKATFDQKNRTLVLTESPVLHDGPNEVAGDRVVVYLDQDRSVVEGGRRRVKAVLFPDNKDEAAKPKAKPPGTDAVSEPSTALLRAEGLTKSYVGRRVVDDVTIEVCAGEVVGLLGPNGAGKTTSFHMIVGLTRPDAGRVFLDGTDVTPLPMYERARRGIGYLPQEPSVFRKLTVEENILAILETLDLAAAERETRLGQLLDELGLAKLAKSKALALSGGERRRLEITRALVISPSFMLLDEPFAGIDPIAVVDIQGIVSQLKRRGIGVLITDHNVRETLGICDRAYIVNEGTLLEEGTPEAIAESPRARQIYLGEKFRL